MPTYEYHCSKCDQSFELVQKITEPALTTCPKDLCRQKKWGKGKVQRAIGAGAGLIFKGSGFYITDYRSESYKEAARKDTSSGSSDTKAKPAEAKTTPAKTETKTTPKKGGTDS